MIQVIYYANHFRVTIEGHAHSGDPGHDLVCAGCSALAYTLGANVENMQAMGQVREAAVKLESGDAEISCKPRNKYTHLSKRIFEAVCVGFELLAASYPRYISYEIHH